MSLTNSTPLEVVSAASKSARTLASLPAQSRNAALTAIHAGLSQSKDDILQANVRDLEKATESARNGQLSGSLVKRLDLSKPGKWEEMLKGILDVRDLDDPGACRFLEDVEPDGVVQWSLPLFCRLAPQMGRLCSCGGGNSGQGHPTNST